MRDRIYNLFVRECRKAADKLGLVDTRIKFMRGLPRGSPENAEAGSLSLGAARKAIIFLNPAQSADLTDDDIKYLALHETLELVITQRLKPLYLDAAGDAADLEAWERNTHELVHRIINLVDGKLMRKE